jgi:hypothetical protein
MRTLETGRIPVLSSLTRASGALLGWTTHSLAPRGNHMEKKHLNQSNITTAETTPEVVAATSSQGPAPSEQDLHPQSEALGTQEVLTHSQQEASTSGKASPTMDLDEGDSTAPPLLEREEELLMSPGSQKSTGTLDDATEQLSQLRMKRPNLTTAQRKEALMAKLKETGETFDPSKWKRGKRKKPQGSVVGEASGSMGGQRAEVRVTKRTRGSTVTPPSAERPSKKAKSGSPGSKEEQLPVNPGASSSGVSYRDISAIKMAIVPDTYPEATLSAEQGEVIEDAIMDEFQPLEDGSAPSFVGTYMEKGALIISCLNEITKKWLETLIPKLTPLGEHSLIKVGLRKDILRSTRIFFRAHPKLSKKTPERIIEMLDKQNPTLNVKEWKVLPARPDPKGYGFVCFLDEACFKAVKSINSRANLGLWQVTIVSTTLRLPFASSSSRRDLIWHLSKNHGCIEEELLAWEKRRVR